MEGERGDRYKLIVELDGKKEAIEVKLDPRLWPAQALELVVAIEMRDNVEIGNS